LRLHNLKRSPETAKGFDTDQAFMLVEIAGDELFFQTVSRTGVTIDSGVLEKQTNVNGSRSAELINLPLIFCPG
jgi:hypothetical protein